MGIDRARDRSNDWALCSAREKELGEWSGVIYADALGPSGMSARICDCHRGVAAAAFFPASCVSVFGCQGPKYYSLRPWMQGLMCSSGDVRARIEFAASELL